MKNITIYISVILFAFIFLVCSFAQSTSNTNKILTTVIFIDSAKFVKELSMDKDIKKLYDEFREKHDYIIYKYDFNLTSFGKIVPGIYGKEASVNKFIKEKFNKYRWKTTCSNDIKIIGYGTLDINLIPSKNIIQIQIYISNGSIEKQNNIKTIMDTVIKM